MLNLVSNNSVKSRRQFSLYINTFFEYFRDLYISMTLTTLSKTSFLGDFSQLHLVSVIDTKYCFEKLRKVTDISLYYMPLQRKLVTFFNHLITIFFYYRIMQVSLLSGENYIIKSY